MTGRGGRHRRVTRAAATRPPSNDAATRVRFDPFAGLEDVPDELVASRLGVSAAEMTAMRSDPGRWVTLGQVKHLLDLRAEVTARESDPPLGPLDLGDPYTMLHQLRRMLATDRWPDGPPFRKPLVGVVGGFDAGKSTLINTLLGRDHVRTAFTPTTTSLAHLRHTADRPACLEHPWVAVDGYDPSKRPTAGRWESWTLATAASQAALEALGHGECDTVAFLDAPLLRAADLVDTPGWGNQDEETDRALGAWPALDAIIWCTSYTHFMGGMERSQLADLITRRRLLPVSPSSSRLGALLVVLTQADVTGIDDDGVERLRNHAADALCHEVAARYSRKDPEPTPARDEILQRIVTFSAESGRRSQALYGHLARLLGHEFPLRRLWQVARSAGPALDWPERRRLLVRDDL